MYLYIYICIVITRIKHNIVIKCTVIYVRFKIARGRSLSCLYIMLYVEGIYIYIYIYYRQSNIVRVPPCAAMEPVQVVAAASAAVRLRV